jgi:hypothetical protein
MSSSKFRNMLLVAFAVLTIIFGSISAYGYIQVQQLKNIGQTTSTTTVTLTPSTTVTTETRFTTSTITVTTNFTTKTSTVPGTIIPKSFFTIFLSESSVQAVQGENKVLCSVTAVAYKYGSSVTTTWSDRIELQQANIVPSGGGFTVSFEPNLISVGDSSTVKGNFTDAVPGTYTVTIRGISSGTAWVQDLVVMVLPRTP